MENMVRRVLTLAGLCGIVAAVTLSAAQDLTRPEADSMDRKLTAIAERGIKPVAKNAKPLRTSFTEREANAYLKFHGPEVMPVGVGNARVVIDNGGKLQARAIVDLDAVRKSKERGYFDPMNLLFGSVEVAAAGTLQAANGKGTFQLQSATLGALPIPKTLLQELITYYTKSPELPNGFDLDKPFDLPANIRQVEVQRGTLTVVQ
jgi:hypothetical protein